MGYRMGHIAERQTKYRYSTNEELALAFIRFTARYPEMDEILLEEIKALEKIASQRRKENAGKNTAKILSIARKQ